MDLLFNDIVPPEDLKKFEKQYYIEQDQGNVSHKAQFEYAWCLVRSQYKSDMQKGILLLEDLSNRHPDGNRDYIYFLAVGNARIKEYTLALKYCKHFLDIEPNNQQALALEEHIQKKLKQDGLVGMAVAGGAALVIGGIVGLGMALAKKSSNNKSK